METVFPRRRSTAPWDPVVIGILAASTAFALSWVPSLWYDEAATVVAATRSWSELGETVQTVDAVHWAWYSLMHLWFDLVGYSPLTLRLPSAVFTGAAAALLVVLAGRLVPRLTSLAAGVLFMVLPRTTFSGAEGRSFALSALCAVALTWVLLYALEQSAQVTDRSAGRRAALWWAGYGLLTVLSAWFFIYLALVVVAHAVTVAIGLARSRDRSVRRRTAVGFVAAAALGAAGTLPLAVLVMGQSGQVGWIDPPSADTPRHVLITQWAPEADDFALLMWFLAGIGALACLIRRHDLGTAGHVALPWLLLPSGLLLLVSLVGDPLWAPRYQHLSSPALALLMAIGATSVLRRRGTAVLLIAAAALSATTWREQREVTAKDGSAWSQIADIVAEERAHQPEDLQEGVIYGPLRRHPEATSRVVAYTYPETFAGVEDFTLRTPAAETGGLWEEQYALPDVADQTDDLDVVWLVTSDRQDIRPEVTELLDQRGFTRDAQWRLSHAYVLKFSR